MQSQLTQPARVDMHMNVLDGGHVLLLLCLDAGNVFWRMVTADDVRQ